MRVVQAPGRVAPICDPRPRTVLVGGAARRDGRAVERRVGGGDARHPVSALGTRVRRSGHDAGAVVRALPGDGDRWRTGAEAAIPGLCDAGVTDGRGRDDTAVSRHRAGPDETSPREGSIGRFAVDHGARTAQRRQDCDHEYLHFAASICFFFKISLRVAREKAKEGK